ncbi:MAG: hypothetical protein NC236_00575 [Mycoplasma sp.]|nr:hypothetical protein [Mycoplasma sp.]
MTKKQKLIIFITPITLSAVAVPIYFLLKNQKEDVEQNNTDENTEIYDDNDSENGKEIHSSISHDIDLDNLFPSLDISYLYNDLRIVGNQPIITDKFISHVIKNIIIGLSTTLGKTKFDVKKISSNQMIVKAIWNYKDITKDKYYFINVNKNNI